MVIFHSYVRLPEGTLCLLQDGFALCLLQDGFGILENHSCLYVSTLAISGWLDSQVGERSRSKVNQRSSVINKQMNRYIDIIYIAAISRIWLAQKPRQIEVVGRLRCNPLPMDLTVTGRGMVNSPKLFGLVVHPLVNVYRTMEIHHLFHDVSWVNQRTTVCHFQ